MFEPAEHSDRYLEFKTQAEVNQQKMRASEDRMLNYFEANDMLNVSYVLDEIEFYNRIDQSMQRAMEREAPLWQTQSL